VHRRRAHLHASRLPRATPARFFLPSCLRALGFAAALIAASLGAGIAFAQDANEAGNWTMPARDYQNTRFSPLDQINASNVRTLTLAWTFSTGVLRGHEAAPIVADNTLYIVTPYPNLVYALDLAQPGAPVKWKFSPNPVSSSRGGVLRSREPGRHLVERSSLLQHTRQPDVRARCPHGNRGMAHATRRHQAGRDDDHGSARRQGPGAGRQQRR